MSAQHQQGGHYDDGYGHQGQQGHQGQDAYYHDDQYGQYHDDQRGGYHDQQGHGDAYYDESCVLTGPAHTHVHTAN